MKNDSKLAYNTKEACSCLGINRNTLDNYRKAGLIRGIKTGRYYIYSRDEIERFLKSNIGKEITKDGKVLVDWDEKKADKEE